MKRSFISVPGWILGGLLLVSGCGQSASETATTRPTEAAAQPEKGGAQIWAENCTRCHNVPPPQRFSDSQWSAIVHHMRLRADLTGEEQRKVTEFLQSAN